jgi:hypothetical protein
MTGLIYNTNNQMVLELSHNDYSVQYKSHTYGTMETKTIDGKIYEITPAKMYYTARMGQWSEDFFFNIEIRIEKK